MNPDDRRVVITGYGMVSGTAVTEVRERLRNEGQSGAARGEGSPDRAARGLLWPPGAPSPSRRADRFTRMAMAATGAALSCAGLTDGLPAEDTGLVFNTCFGPFDSTRRYLTKLIQDGGKRVSAAVFPNTAHNTFSATVTESVQALGSNATVSGQNPLCLAFEALRRGRDDIVIAGGCEEYLPVIESGFEHARRAGRWRRSGVREGDPAQRFRLGEGACVLILEREVVARGRGAGPLAAIQEYGITNGTGPRGLPFEADSQCIRRAMEQALERSGTARTDVTMIVGTANGVAALDAAERTAIRDVFGAGPPEVLSIKRLIGETLGAASTFNTLAAVLALQPRARGGRVLVNAYELGGTMTSLVVSRVPTAAGVGGETQQ